MKRPVRYRLEIDFYSRDYENKALCESSPIYTLKEGKQAYKQAIENEKCLDNPSLPVRVHLWKYAYDENGYLQPVTILKNYR